MEEIIIFIVALVCAALSIAGSIIPVIPGPILGYGSLWLAQWSGYCAFSNQFMIVMAIATAAVFAADYILPPLITRKMGGSKAASWGATLGMLFGMFFTPVGMIAGMLIGAFVGEMIFARNTSDKSVRAALGAFLGFLLGTGLKLILCFYILYSIVVTAIENTGYQG